MFKKKNGMLSLRMDLSHRSRLIWLVHYGTIEILQSELYKMFAANCYTKNKHPINTVWNVLLLPRLQQKKPV